jgi:hypothetical protein
MANRRVPLLRALLSCPQMAALLKFVLVAVDWEQTRPRALLPTRRGRLAREGRRVRPRRELARVLGRSSSHLLTRHRLSARPLLLLRAQPRPTAWLWPPSRPGIVYPSLFGLGKNSGRSDLVVDASCRCFSLVRALCIFSARRTPSLVAEQLTHGAQLVSTSSIVYTVRSASLAPIRARPCRHCRVVAGDSSSFSLSQCLGGLTRTALSLTQHGVSSPLWPARRVLGICAHILVGAKYLRAAHTHLC